MKEIRKVDWKNEAYTDFYRFGDGIVLHGLYMYDYDNECWRYAPDLFFEYGLEGGEFDTITEAEARKIVEENGGKKFNDFGVALFVTDESGKLSAID